MQSLEQYGWSSFFQSPTPLHPGEPGRVVSIKGFKYEIVYAGGALVCELTGKLLFGSSSADLPKVGDWVLCMTYGAEGYIVDVLPRLNELARKSAGARTDRQVLAVNLDAALVVQGLDSNFNMMRLDRYLMQLAGCNIPAVVVLNKADLIDDLPHYLTEIEKLQRDVPVYACSTYNGVGIGKLLEEVLLPQKTYALIGSSGVGKSSLLNAWRGTSQQVTNSIGAGTGKGKHTTTTRDLFMLANGSLVIDTPGMREFGITVEEGNDADDLFPAIALLAQRCRYSDCAHLGEEGCAVAQALEEGSLDIVVYESYVKLMKEQRRFHVKATDKKRIEKQFGKMTREASNHRKKHKY